MVRYTAFRKCDKRKERKQFVVCSSVMCVIPRGYRNVGTINVKTHKKGKAISRIQDQLLLESKEQNKIFMLFLLC